MWGASSEHGSPVDPYTTLSTLAAGPHACCTIEAVVTVTYVAWTFDRPSTPFKKPVRGMGVLVVVCVSVRGGVREWATGLTQKRQRQGAAGRRGLEVCVGHGALVVWRPGCWGGCDGKVAYL